MDSTTVAKPLLLRPRKSPLVEKLLSRRALLRDLTLACGSPLNILLPDQIAHNADAFKTVLLNHGLSGKIFFAHKSNQSSSLIRQMATEGLNADVASLEELRHALAAGFPGDRLEATGPKSPEFIALSLQHGLAINADSLQEIKDIAQVAATIKLAEPARVLLRFCGFSAAHTPVLSKQSRFGIAFAKHEEALNAVAAQPALHLLGFSFHLDSISIDERVVAIENCLTAFEKALALGMEPRVLDVGGGFRINYLDNEGDWNTYTTAIRESALGLGPPVTWQHNHFGLAADNGVLRGKLNSYGYWEPRPGALFLEDLLNSEMPGFNNQRLSDVLRENMIELWIEPGRALLDQCGLTIARVNSVKQSSDGQTLIGLNMKRQDIAFLDQEVFVDPVLVSKRKATGAVSVFFCGNLCLESDLIFRHKVWLPFLPKPGDIVALINTAAYMMDFSATRSIMQPPARRVAVVEDKNRFVWMLDELYTPIWRLNR